MEYQATRKGNPHVDVLMKFDKCYEESRKYRQGFEEGWKEFEKFYRLEHWRDPKRPAKNYCFAMIETTVPILLDTLPGIDVVPYDEDDKDKASVLDSAIDYVLESQNYMMKLAGVCRNFMKTGTGWIYVDWDPDLEDGQGQVTLTPLNWRFVYIDPSASDIDEARYAIIEIPVATDELKRRFPEKADEIFSSKVNQGFSGQDKTVSGYKHDTWHGDNTDNSYKDKYDVDNITLLREFWHKDFSMTKISPEETIQMIEEETEQFMNGENPDVGKWEDHAAHIEAHTKLKYEIAAEALSLFMGDITEEDIEELKRMDPMVGLALSMIDDHLEMHASLYEQNPKAEKPKYKNNLRLTLRAGDVVLYDGDTPEGDGLIPLVPYYNYKDDESIFGTGEIKNMLPMQKVLNEMDFAELQGLRLCSNPGWVYDAESEVDESQLTNEPGIRIEKRQGTDVQRLAPGQVSPQLASRKEEERQALQQISGINEVIQGLKQGGVTAARAIERLLSQSNSRIRLKAIQMQIYSTKRLGALIGSRVLNRWTNERQLRIYDKNGQLKYIEWNPDLMQNFGYEIKIVPGSVVGYDKEAILTTMENLFQTGRIDAETFFELTDLPYKNTILEKIAESKEKDALLAQLAEENQLLKEQGAQVLEENQIMKEEGAKVLDEIGAVQSPIAQ